MFYLLSQIRLGKIYLKEKKNSTSSFTKSYIFPSVSTLVKWMLGIELFLSEKSITHILTVRRSLLVQLYFTI